MDEDRLTSEQRRAMLDLLERSALKDYPNPQRIGCPGSPFLKRLATDRRSIPLSDTRLEHVARCSPCFSEFVQYRDAARRRVVTRRSAMGIGTALAAGIAAFLIRSAVTPSHDLKYERAEINLLAFGEQRGASSQTAIAPVNLPRKALDLLITLPFASPTGEYQIQVLRSDGSETGIKASGNAYRSGGKTVLQVRLNVSALPPAEYQLGYRHVPFDTIPVPIKIK